MNKKPGLEPGFLLDELLVRSVPKPEVFNGLGHVPLERDDFSSNRHPALSFCLSMIFSENRYPLFRIML